MLSIFFRNMAGAQLLGVLFRVASARSRESVSFISRNCSSRIPLDSPRGNRSACRRQKAIGSLLISQFVSAMILAGRNANQFLERVRKESRFRVSHLGGDP